MKVGRKNLVESWLREESSASQPDHNFDVQGLLLILSCRYLCGCDCSCDFVTDLHTSLELRILPLEAGKENMNKTGRIFVTI